MSLAKVFDIAASGMSAQAIRMNTVASNMANSNNVNGDPAKVYRAMQPVFSTVMMGTQNDPASAGVRVDDILRSDKDPAKLYAPDNPLANEEGYVYQSNVNFAEEMANMISASRSYQNNVEMMNTTKQLMLATLRLGE
jgi:flagellar basal-body rod protein FlgC